MKEKLLPLAERAREKSLRRRSGLYFKEVQSKTARKRSAEKRRLRKPKEKENVVFNLHDGKVQHEG